MQNAYAVNSDRGQPSFPPQKLRKSSPRPAGSTILWADRAKKPWRRRWSLDRIRARQRERTAFGTLAAYFSTPSSSSSLFFAFRSTRPAYLPSKWKVNSILSGAICRTVERFQQTRVRRPAHRLRGYEPRVLKEIFYQESCVRGHRRLSQARRRRERKFAPGVRAECQCGFVIQGVREVTLQFTNCSNVIFYKLFAI